MANRDLWGTDFAVPKIVTPITLLRETAALLSEKTTGLVLAEVVVQESLRGGLTARFYLVAPRLDNYRYQVFSIDYRLDGYPVKLRFGSQESICEDEAGFETAVGEILAHQATRTVIGSLIDLVSE